MTLPLVRWSPRSDQYTGPEYGGTLCGVRYRWDLVHQWCKALLYGLGCSLSCPVVGWLVVRRNRNRRLLLHRRWLKFIVGDCLLTIALIGGFFQTFFRTDSLATWLLAQTFSSSSSSFFTIFYRKMTKKRTGNLRRVWTLFSPGCFLVSKAWRPGISFRCC